MTIFNNLLFHYYGTKIVVRSDKVLKASKMKRWSKFDSDNSYDAFLKDEVKKFLDDNFGNTYRHIITPDLYNETFIFLNKEDAMLFKLAML